MKKIILMLSLTFSLFANNVFDEELRNSFKTINEGMPIHLAKSVLWTKVYVEDKTVFYHFLFEDENMKFSDKTKQETLFNMCTEQTNKLIISQGYSLIAKYFYKNKQIEEIVVNAETCRYK